MKTAELRLVGVATAALVALAGVLYFLSIERTGGEYIYPIDDAYIHLTLAKNLAGHGVYGIHPDTFTAASSSIGWPMLLAALYRSWPSPSVGLVASLGSAALLPLAVREALTRVPRAPLPLGLHAATQALVLLAMPVVPLALSGMEHTAHALVTLLLVTECLRGTVANEGGGGWRRVARLAFLALCATTLRYESLATCALCTLVLVRAKDRTGAAVVATCALLPPLAFALYSKAHGWSALPNSVVLKARRWDADAPAALLTKLKEAPHLPLLFALLALALFLTRRIPSTAARSFGWVALGTLTAHVLFGAVGWFYRYEAYVIPLCVVALALLWADLRAKSPKLVVAYAIVLLLLLPRGFSALRALPYASRNIFDEQVRTARFLDANFAGEEVLVNDIGAVAYFSKVRVIDLMGLANQETAKARGMRIDRPLAPGTLEKLSARTNVAVVYDQWFNGEIPSSWTKVGEFETTNNRVCAFPQVAIYATNPGSVSRARAAFERYEPRR